MRFGVKGVAFLQVWLMIFGFVAVVGLMGVVEGYDDEILFDEWGGVIEGGENDIIPAEVLKETNSPNPKKSISSILSLAGFRSQQKAIATIKGVESDNLPNSGDVKVTHIKSGNAKANLGSEYLSQTPGSGANALTMGLAWAVGAYIAGTMIGNFLGMEEGNSNALGAGLAAGFGTYTTLSTYFGSGGVGASSGMFSAKTSSFLGAHAGMIGLGVGVLIFAMMYKDVETKTVTFDCMPWQAPNGGDSCEVCNDADLPCSEYRCKALGQACEIVNAGTEEERCVYVNPRDVSPPVIMPNYIELTKGHEYRNVKNSPPGPGFDIENVAAVDGCLKAFTPLEFGLTLDEPGQCKIDFNHTLKFDDMAAYVGGNSLYSYNHSERFSLPSSEVLAESGFQIVNGEEMTFFVRCKDKNGNENGAEYAVNFCVDPTPDATAPKIEATSIVNGGCVAENTESAEVRFYTNEPASCRWSNVDQAYENMVNEMSCSNAVYQANAAQLFTCTSTLGGIPRDGADYYVRCEDYAEDKNVMRQSYVFSLRGSTGLVLKNLKPNESLSGGISPMPVELYAESLFGCNNGKAVCEWSSDGSSYIQFFDTNKDDGIHTQRLDLGPGRHEYFVRCVDEGGNVVTDSISFNLDIDSSPPMIARIYEEGEMLKIVTIRDSECAYTHTDCDFTFVEGTGMPYGNTTIHVAEWNEDKTYYIKCRDEFLNVGAGCSAVVRPTTNFL